MGREVKGSNLHHRRSGLHHLDRFAKAILLKARRLIERGLKVKGKG
jgi:hypothetical protein